MQLPIFGRVKSCILFAVRVTDHIEVHVESTLSFSGMVRARSEDESWIIELEAA